MILIVSVILIFCFALSAVFIGFTPNIYRLVDKDFVSKAIKSAELEAMRYGDVYLRAGVLDTNTTPSRRIIRPEPAFLLMWLMLPAVL